MTNDIQCSKGEFIRMPKIIIESLPDSESNYFRQLFDNAPRHCIRETFNESLLHSCAHSPWIKVWTFHYSDGTTEQLRRIIEK